MNPRHKKLLRMKLLAAKQEAPVVVEETIVPVIETVSEQVVENVVSEEAAEEAPKPKATKKAK
jgi:hypothetical protein